MIELNPVRWHQPSIRRVVPMLVRHPRFGEGLLRGVDGDMFHIEFPTCRIWLALSLTEVDFFMATTPSIQ